MVQPPLILAAQSMQRLLTFGAGVGLQDAGGALQQLDAATLGALSRQVLHAWRGNFRRKVAQRDYQRLLLLQ